jgi:hypothetical protein
MRSRWLAYGLSTISNQPESTTRGSGHHSFKVDRRGRIDSNFGCVAGRWKESCRWTGCGAFGREADLNNTGLQMKHISFYCTIADEVESTGVRNKHIWIGYIITFVWRAFHRCSVRAAWMDLQIPHLYSVSLYTLSSISKVTLVTLSRTLSVSSGKVLANGGSTLYPWCTPNKKSREVRSGERGGQVTGPPLPVHLSGSFQVFSRKGYNAAAAPPLKQGSPEVYSRGTFVPSE